MEQPKDQSCSCLLSHGFKRCGLDGKILQGLSEDMLAISYVWSEGLPTHEQCVEWCNLLGVSSYWIDQRCIRQDCMLDVTAQIGSMGDVYLTASSVIVVASRQPSSLPEDEFMINFTALMNTIADILNDDIEIDKPPAAFIEQACSLAFRQIIEQTLNSKWADRVWTFQEGNLNPNTLIWQGGFLTHLDRYRDIVYGISKVYEHSLITSELTERAERWMAHVDFDRGKENFATIFEILARSECYDPIDRIYAAGPMLGINFPPGMADPSELAGWLMRECAIKRSDLSFMTCAVKPVATVQYDPILTPLGTGWTGVVDINDSESTEIASVKSMTIECSHPTVMLCIGTRIFPALSIICGSINAGLTLDNWLQIECPSVASQVLAVAQLLRISSSAPNVLLHQSTIRNPAGSVIAPQANIPIETLQEIDDLMMACLDGSIIPDVAASFARCSVHQWTTVLTECSRIVLIPHVNRLTAVEGATVTMISNLSLGTAPVVALTRLANGNRLEFVGAGPLIEDWGLDEVSHSVDNGHHFELQLMELANSYIDWFMETGSRLEISSAWGDHLRQVGLCRVGGEVDWKLELKELRQRFGTSGRLDDGSSDNSNIFGIMYAIQTGFRLYGGPELGQGVLLADGWLPLSVYGTGFTISGFGLATERNGQRWLVLNIVTMRGIHQISKPEPFDWSSSEFTISWPHEVEIMARPCTEGQVVTGLLKEVETWKVRKLQCVVVDIDLNGL
ncbi:hypothetical protein HK096_005220 [Nowakowskiella sp. JEL0078]|nr:hypothetical protein HK096_005220 [Nowakowskiella sp. JEL0078]